MPNDDSKPLTVQEIADLMRVSSRTVQRWLASGILLGVRVGGVWRIRADQPMLEDLMK